MILRLSFFKFLKNIRYAFRNVFKLYTCKDKYIFQSLQKNKANRKYTNINTTTE